MDGCEISVKIRHKIKFTDPTFETAETLRYFLELLDGSWYPPAGKPLLFDLLRALFAFADKWECRLVAAALTRSLLTFATHSQSAVSNAFLLAARRGETGVCANILRNASGPAGKWEHAQSRVVKGHALAGYWVHDPAGMEPSIFGAMPRLYLWALTRVFQNWRVNETYEMASWLRNEWADRKHARTCGFNKCQTRDPDSEEEEDDDSDPEYKAREPSWAKMAEAFTRLIKRHSACVQSKESCGGMCWTPGSGLH